MGKSVLILVQGEPSQRDARLSQILAFFGVDRRYVALGDVVNIREVGDKSVVFASALTLTTVLSSSGHHLQSFLGGADSVYVFADADPRVSASALQQLLGDGTISANAAAPGRHVLHVTAALPDLVGAMAGIEVSVLAVPGTNVVRGGQQQRRTSIVTAEGGDLFIRFMREDVPIYFCGSPEIVDLEEPVESGYYDVKRHFASVVPLIMFIQSAFGRTAWRAQELGACLIVDDPLLKLKYGHCDFGKLCTLMCEHDFTTNIAFIPWNWKRTSTANAEFFRIHSDRFSVSIHGCDHTNAEFGSASVEKLDSLARLAQFRMENHKIRTGIRHDEIMVFPQGVFSSACLEPLKRNNFLAAVNTETEPADSENCRPVLRDVWDVAIRSYGTGFPIFTRRYAFHGIENFAFDLLLGKPCLIVAHHDFFRDGAAQVVDLIQKLKSLNCDLKWRSLGDVLRRACRLRYTDAHERLVEMYGNELVLENSSDHKVTFLVQKQESRATDIEDVSSGGSAIPFRCRPQYFEFNDVVPPFAQKAIQVRYRRMTHGTSRTAFFPAQLPVMVRRVLCEFRDDYLSKSPFLSKTAARLKHIGNRPQ